MSPASARARVWRAPALVALASALGLGLALVADGAGDALGWLALATPAVLAIWYALPAVQRAQARSRARRAVGGPRSDENDN